MALEDIFEDSLPGLVVGAVAAAVLLPLFGVRRAAFGAAGAAAATGGSVGRPIVKAAVRGYLNVADKMKEFTAEAREQMSDLVAEVREENRLRAEQPVAAPEPAQG